MLVEFFKNDRDSFDQGNIEIKVCFLLNCSIFIDDRIYAIFMTNHAALPCFDFLSLICVGCIAFS